MDVCEIDYSIVAEWRKGMILHMINKLKIKELHWFKSVPYAYVYIIPKSGYKPDASPVKLSIKSTHLLVLFIDSTFVTNWWRFMELNAPQTMFSTWTPAPTTSSVAISSSTSRMPPSKTTYMWVRSVSHRVACLSTFAFTFLKVTSCLLPAFRKVYPCNSSTSAEQSQKYTCSGRWDGFSSRQQWNGVSLSKQRKNKLTSWFFLSATLSILAAVLLLSPEEGRLTERRPKGGGRRSET